MKKLIVGVLLIGCIEAAQAQHYNTVLGESAFSSDINGSYNNAVGAWALYYNTTGQNNTATGFESLFNNTDGNHNTATGMYSLFNNLNGIENTAVGYQSLFSNQSGNNNIAIGYQAGFVPANGNNNIEIGHIGLANDTGVIRIGTQGVQRFTQIAGIRGVAVKNGQAVLVSPTGQLGVSAAKVLTTADAVSLRSEIAQLRQELNALKSRSKP